jgi:hypothetical protein
VPPERVRTAPAALQYLDALVSLHDAMRRRADAGNADVSAELERLGLTTVSI